MNDISSGRKEQINSYFSEEVLITTDDILNMLSILPNNSVDYVFTDPPYAGTMPYAALNCIWDYWLAYNPDYSFEILGDNWRSRMADICREFFRIIKPGRRISICYHDTSEGTWHDLQDVMSLAGFIPEEISQALGIETSQKSYQQLVGDKVTKRDLVITFVKPLPGNVDWRVAPFGDNDITFRDNVISVINEFLECYPGSSKDRIYDEVVSRMVRIGKMEPHDFMGILNLTAEQAAEDPTKWYLKNCDGEYGIAENAKEDSASNILSEFMEKWNKANPGSEGVHYSELFQYYLVSVKEKPRRPLVDLLLDYFYKTDDGTYRLPSSDEERRLKVEGRLKGTQRRIKRYITFLHQGVVISDKERPNDSTLSEWIRHCKRSGLYDLGKLLYEKGGLNLDNLREEAMVNVEEDYQVCVRMLARGGGASTESKPKRGRKAKA